MTTGGVVVLFTNPLASVLQKNTRPLPGRGLCDPTDLKLPSWGVRTHVCTGHMSALHCGVSVDLQVWDTRVHVLRVSSSTPYFQSLATFLRALSVRPELTEIQGEVLGLHRAHPEPVSLGPDRNPVSSQTAHDAGATDLLPE